MTKKQVAELLHKIALHYTFAYQGHNTEKQKAELAGAWYEILKDEDNERINLALQAFIKTDIKGYPPSVGQLINSQTKSREERIAKNQGLLL